MWAGAICGNCGAKRKLHKLRSKSSRSPSPLPGVSRSIQPKEADDGEVDKEAGSSTQPKSEDSGGEEDRASLDLAQVEFAPSLHVPLRPPSALRDSSKLAATSERRIVFMDELPPNTQKELQLKEVKQRFDTFQTLQEILRTMSEMTESPETQAQLTALNRRVDLEKTSRLRRTLSTQMLQADVAVLALQEEEARLAKKMAVLEQAEKMEQMRRSAQPPAKPEIQDTKKEPPSDENYDQSIAELLTEVTTLKNQVMAGLKRPTATPQSPTRSPRRAVALRQATLHSSPQLRQMIQANNAASLSTKSAQSSQPPSSHSASQSASSHSTSSSQSVQSSSFSSSNTATPAAKEAWLLRETTTPPANLTSRPAHRTSSSLSSAQLSDELGKLNMQSAERVPLKRNSLNLPQTRTMGSANKAKSRRDSEPVPEHTKKDYTDLRTAVLSKVTDHLSRTRRHLSAEEEEIAKLKKQVEQEKLALADMEEPTSRPRHASVHRRKPTAMSTLELSAEVENLRAEVAREKESLRLMSIRR